MKFSKTYLFLIFIVLTFLFTRLYKISEIPSSVYWDEASIGYNAYSILQTGKDEWGETFPLHFRAFGEFKLPVYIYAVVPAVWIFGLNALAVRLPAVVFSLGVVILTYLLGRKLSGSKEVGLFSSFLVAVSPWFFIFSRTGYEATSGLMFYLLGIYLFILQKNKWLIFFSVLSFILSAYSYNSFRIISPLTIAVLGLFYFNQLKVIKKGLIPLILSVVILIASIIPIYRVYVFDSGAARLQTVGAAKSDFLKNYLSHFNPAFLFIKGDTNLRSQQGSFGQLFPVEAVLLIAGLIYICRKAKNGILLLILLLLAPIPASLTRESPHALRAISIVPFISIISAYGAFAIREWIKRGYIYFIIAAVFLIFFANYFWSFLRVYPQESKTDWQYEYKTIYSELREKIGSYNKVLISDKYAQPYIFALFYLKYDPVRFRQEVIRNSVDQWGFSTVKSFGKFEFGKFEKVVYQ